MGRTIKSRPVLDPLEDRTLLSAVVPLVPPTGGAVVTGESFSMQGSSTRLDQTVAAGSIRDSERFALTVTRGSGSLAGATPGYSTTDAINQFIRALDSATSVSPPSSVLGTPAATVLRESMTPTSRGMVFTMEIASGSERYLASYQLSSRPSGKTTPAVAFSSADAIDDFGRELAAQVAQSQTLHALGAAVSPFGMVTASTSATITTGSASTMATSPGIPNGTLPKLNPGATTTGTETSTVGQRLAAVLTSGPRTILPRLAVRIGVNGLPRPNASPPPSSSTAGTTAVGTHSSSGTVTNGTTTGQGLTSTSSGMTGAATTLNNLTQTSTSALAATILADLQALAAANLNSSGTG